MKIHKFVWIGFFTILLIGSVSAKSLFPSLQDLIERSQQQGQDQSNQDTNQQAPQGDCNNDGVCNIGESNANCPNDCPVEQRQTTQQPSAPPSDVSDEQEILTDYEEGMFPNNLVIATLVVVVFIGLLIVLGFWLYGKKGKGKITFGKKPEEKKDIFKLPQRPERRFGI